MFDLGRHSGSNGENPEVNSHRERLPNGIVTHIRWMRSLIHPCLLMIFTL